MLKILLNKRMKQSVKSYLQKAQNQMKRLQKEQQISQNLFQQIQPFISKNSYQKMFSHLNFNTQIFLEQSLLQKNNLDQINGANSIFNQHYLGQKVSDFLYYRHLLFTKKLSTLLKYKKKQLKIYMQVSKEITIFIIYVLPIKSNQILSILS
ncbi:hypothetical protein TTHERM_000755821 (macronuclear) [Tetrahymena thermophila SB210]|uniref:Uncharacterized protein n=1 Tax=Tetrahymena thermophila (strain SB210) TaxID=312017 RepID=W7WXX6_TETTS|nr:hypothetical protein TTHERM_000755821 [Tetrahymena thermophila SB210]EWS71705.1 hypothetical protein TTHERM_000755821 [Tetrahymena thermophila SB210]|eukprot:XP_012655746.1 hypothetical protein TTHERM_000755821 [Tetrahymena thermophila SB210]